MVGIWRTSQIHRTLSPKRRSYRCKTVFAELENRAEDPCNGKMLASMMKLDGTGSPGWEGVGWGGDRHLVMERDYSCPVAHSSGRGRL